MLMVFMEFTRYCYFLDAFSGQKGVRKLVFKCVPTIICRGKNTLQWCIDYRYVFLYPYISLIV